MTAELPVRFPATAQRAIVRVEADEAVDALAHHNREMAEAMIGRGDGCPVGDTEDPNDLECRLTHFVWAERGKHFLMLYRDVQLQLQLARLLQHEEQADPKAVDKLYQESRAALSDALTEWEEDFAARKESLERNARERRKQLRTWKLQQNPWPIYRQQLLDLAGQSENLATEYAALLEESDRFTEIRKQLEAAIAVSRTALNTAEERARNVVRSINEGEADAQRPGAIAARLDDHLAAEGTLPRLDRFTNRITAATAKLSEEQRVTVASEEGILKYKEVNFRRATDQWLSAEVMPLLYELWEVSEQLTNGLNVAFVNVRNRALLLSNELKAGQEVQYNARELAQPIENYLERAGQQMQAYTDLRDQLCRRIERDLRLTSVYRPEAGFLPLPLQTGLNAFTRRQGRLLSGIGDWLDRRVNGINAFLGNAAREEQLSVSEKTVRVIRQRTVSADNAAYTNILLTRGYIGESFLVGRRSETEHMAQLIENWRQGFRGAVILTGRRLAGKTLFGEHVTNRFFPGQTIRLRPHSPLTVAGRPTKTTGSLQEALAFVQKYTMQLRPLVWIDDLERWHEEDHPLAANVRALGEYIDDYSGRIFFLVSTTNAVYRHLNRYLHVDRVFQSEINLDPFTLEDMKQAILIRHGATHKVMVDAQGEPISEATFGKMVRRIYRSAEGNVGDTINRWAYFTERYGEEQVYQPGNRRYELPAFLSPDTATLLTTIYLEKQTQDYRLRRLFGPSYPDRYGTILQRLIRIGMVTRSPDGRLEITESIVNDVGRMLAAESYLPTLS
jgi:uncharacterized protein YbgA (DUF1722 family)